ncbi:hypothetical protein pb186bvf_012305 [Paramecium bursaria]
MYQQGRFCNVVNHQQELIKYVCIHDDQCLYEELHKHEEINNNHLINHKKFTDLIQQNVKELIQKQNINLNQFKIAIDNINGLISNISQYMSEITKIVYYYQKNTVSDHDLDTLQQYIKDGEAINFTLLDEETLDNFEINQINKITSSIIKNVQHIEYWAENFQYLAPLIKEAKYENIIVKESQDNNEIYSAQISNVFQYVAFGGDDKLLQIWSLEQNEMIYQIQLDFDLDSYRFSDDDRFLFVGLGDGQLIQFDCYDDFNQVFSYELHDDSIQIIYCVTDEDLITASLDKSIKSSNINEIIAQNYLINMAHQDIIKDIDYDKDNEILVSCSIDQSIKFWDNEGNLQINRQQAHDNQINQVKSYKKINNLISLDVQTIKIWKINYEQKIIELERTFNDKFDIVNFSIVLNSQFFIFVCQNCVKVYTFSGEQLNQFNNNIEDLCMYQLLIRFIQYSLTNFHGSNFDKRKKSVINLQSQYMINQIYNIIIFTNLYFILYYIDLYHPLKYDQTRSFIIIKNQDSKLKAFARNLINSNIMSQQQKKLQQLIALLIYIVINSMKSDIGQKYEKYKELKIIQILQFKNILEYLMISISKCQSFKKKKEA